MVGEELGLGVSNVVMKKSPITIKKEFEATKSEWVGTSSTYQRVMASEESTTTPTVMYAVPNDKILYLTSVCISLVCDGTGANTGYSVSMDITDASGNFVDVLCSLMLKEDVSGYSSASYDFPMPIKVNPLEKIEIGTAAAGSGVSGHFVGWLQDIKVVPEAT